MSKTRRIIAHALHLLGPEPESTLAVRFDLFRPFANRTTRFAVRMNTNALTNATRNQSFNAA